jgi:hypothetical protein
VKLAVYVRLDNELVHTGEARDLCSNQTRPVGFIEDRYGLKLQVLNNIGCEMQIPSYIKIRSLVPET